VRLALAILLASLAARAADPPAIAVTEFQAEAQDRDRAKGLSGVVAARLASFRARVVSLDEIRAALDLEKQKQMLGCSEEAAGKRSPARWASATWCTGGSTASARARC
jgi:hypothetical protein